MGDEATRPVNLAAFPSGELGIVWADGRECYLGGHALRCACTCARCVDEVTGQRVVVEDRVPREVRPLEVLPVGRYGISIRWSDGHDTGIYSFEYLRSLCDRLGG
jgi:DUF971 family protein